MSIYKRTKSIRSPKYLEKKRKTRLILSILIPIASLSIISAFILLLRLQWFRVYEVSIVGIKDNGLSSNVIQTMNGSYFKLIPKDSSIILPKSEIIKNLKNSFKNIENIDISRQGLNKIIINIKSKDLVAILCDGFEGDTDQKCYSIDEEGNIFSEYDGDLNNPDLDKYYTSSTTDNGIIGTKFVSKQRLIEFNNFFKGLSSIGISPLGILINDGGQYELYIKDKSLDKVSSSSITVYMDDKNSLTKILSNFQLFWKNYKNSNNKNEEFDYIDMRFGNTVFYATKK
jgi:cell division septal protein FtsQ